MKETNKFAPFENYEEFSKIDLILKIAHANIEHYLNNLIRKIEIEFNKEDKNVSIN